MAETTINTVTIPLEQYMDLCHKAEMNGFLMNELGRFEARFNDINRDMLDLRDRLEKLEGGRNKNE